MLFLDVLEYIWYNYNIYCVKTSRYIILKRILMKSKVEQYAKGDFYVEYPEVKFSKSYIQIKVEAGSVYTDSILITSENDIPMKMMVYDDAYLLKLSDHSIIGRKGEVKFSFSGQNKIRGNTYSGNIHVIGNGMEKTIPYNIEIVAPFIDVDKVAIEDLMKFSALAENDWNKAISIFYSDEFIGTLLAGHEDYVEAYRSLQQSLDRNQALEEFLVYIHKKRALTLQVEHDRFQYNYPKMREEHQLVLKKNTWGYCRMQVYTDCRFITLHQSEVCSMDFKDNEGIISYTLDPELLEEDQGAAGHIIIGAMRKRRGIIMRGKRNEFIPFPRNFSNHVMRQPVIFPLKHRHFHMPRMLPYQPDRFRGMKHGAENLSFLPHNLFPKISLIDIPMRIIHIPVLEQDPLRPGPHQIMIGEKADTLGIQQDDPVLRAGHGYRIQSGHVVKLAFHFPAATPVKGFAGNLRPVCLHGAGLHLRHRNTKGFQVRGDAYLLTLSLQEFRNPELLRRTAGVRKVGVFKDGFQSDFRHAFFLPCSSRYSDYITSTDTGQSVAADMFPAGSFSFIVDMVCALPRPLLFSRETHTRGNSDAQQVFSS